MSRQISEADYSALVKQLKLSQANVDAVEAAFKKTEGAISKTQLLKIFSEYSFNELLLDDHIRLYLAKTKPAPKKPAVDDKPVSTKLLGRIDCDIPMKISYELLPDGTIRNFSMEAVL